MGRTANNATADRNDKNELNKKAVNPPAAKADASAAKAPAEAAGVYVYIGPSIPGGLLKENSIFRGKLSEIHAHLAHDIERYPRAKLLIVPADRLAEQKQRLANGGNAMSNTYRELSAAIKKQ